MRQSTGIACWLFGMAVCWRETALRNLLTFGFMRLSFAKLSAKLCYGRLLFFYRKLTGTTIRKSELFTGSDEGRFTDSIV